MTAFLIVQAVAWALLGVWAHLTLTYPSKLKQPIIYAFTLAFCAIQSAWAMFLVFH